jgi:hypothetical protein
LTGRTGNDRFSACLRWNGRSAKYAAMTFRKSIARKTCEEATMATLITSQDMEYMKAFPADRKVKIMREIMSRSPVAERNFEGNTYCVKTILQLRADGLRLIDLQPLECAFTSIWYKRNGSLLGRAKTEVAAMVVWEGNDRDDDVTTVKIWKI